MSDCIFCDIAAGTMDAAVVHRDDEVVAFRDINPQAPTHILVIPREHIASADEITPSEYPLWGRILGVAQQLAADDGVAEGYRLVTSIGAEGGQTVSHLHVHVLGGRQMTWPPG